MSAWMTRISAISDDQLYDELRDSQLRFHITHPIIATYLIERISTLLKHDPAHQPAHIKNLLAHLHFRAGGYNAAIEQWKSVKYANRTAPTSQLFMNGGQVIALYQLNGGNLDIKSALHIQQLTLAMTPFFDCSWITHVCTALCCLTWARIPETKDPKLHYFRRAIEDFDTALTTGISSRQDVFNLFDQQWLFEHIKQWKQDAVQQIEHMCEDDIDELCSDCDQLGVGPCIDCIELYRYNDENEVGLTNG